METEVIRQAVILAGTDEAPSEAEPLAALSADGEPIINHILWNLARHGVTEVVITGELVQKSFISAVEAHPVPGVSVRFSDDCLPMVDERFLVLDGHSFLDVNYLDLALRAGGGAAVALRSVDNVSGKDRAAFEDGMVREFCKAGKAGKGIIFGGVCCLSRDMCGSLLAGMSGLERELLPKLAGKGRLAGLVCPGLFIDLAGGAAFDRVKAEFSAWRGKPALFLDRDGVLNVNYGYVHTREKWTWCPGAREAVKFANDAGLLVILVTNQSGIGRQYYGEDDFYGLMAWVGEELADVGAHLDGVYHCPHHPTEGVGDFKRECECRKPNPGMLLQAIAEWRVDVDRSAVIGDSERDLEAGRRAGVRRLRLYDPEQENLLDVVREVFSFLFGK